jgi:tripartite-type tricarboxylate transporter receptor subunit TctC
MRIVADELSKTWRQQAVVVENRPGGGGVVGAQAVLSAPADGHMLLAAGASTFTVLPIQNQKLPFNPTQDFVPLALISNEPMVVAVSSKLGIKSLAEALERAKADPNAFIIQTNPFGSLPHLTAKLLTSLSHAPFAVVPSTGGTNDAIREILGGRAHGVIDGLPALRAYIQSGDLTPLAIMSNERLASMPDLPTATETVPGLLAIGWAAVAAPRSVPPDVAKQLASDFKSALQTPAVQARLDKVGTPLRPVFGDDLARFVEDERRLWEPVVKETMRN